MLTAYVACPGSYLCVETEEIEHQMCVSYSVVCDGSMDCAAGDDETSCGEYLDVHSIPFIRRLFIAS